MRRPALALAATLTALVAGSLAPAQAITGGELDTEHPYVGLVVAFPANPQDEPYVCSGAFFDADTFVTAGHCVDNDPVRLEVRLGEGPLDSDVPVVGEVTNVVLHDDYDPSDFTAHDLAVVELGPDDSAELDTYAQLPTQDVLDGYSPSVDTTFTAVGYGLTQAPTPQRPEHEYVRRAAEPRLLKINHRETGEGSFVVSANSRTGGTCAGDSGGPVLLPGTDTVVGVVSYGKNAMCGGQSGIYRIDRADDLAFLAPFVD